MSHPRLLVSLMLACALAQPSAAEGTRVVTVLDLETSGMSRAEMRSLISLVSSALFRSGLFSVIDIAERDRLLKEQEFSAGDCADASCQVRIGQLLSAELVVVGSVAKVGSRHVVSLKMLDVATSRTVGAADGIYADLDSVVDGIRSLVAELAGAPSSVAPAPAAATPRGRIAMCFDVGGRGDKSFNDSAYAGLLRVARDFQGFIRDDPDRVEFGRSLEIRYASPRDGGQDREQIARALAGEGYNPIFAVGFLYVDSVAKLAKEFPRTQWVLIDGSVGDLTETSNVTCLTFAEHEGSFLVGALAGLMVEDRKVGFLGGMDIPLIHKFQGGFFAGAMYTNVALRDARNRLGQYAGKDPGAFNDPRTGESIAQALYKQGAQIIYHASGGTGNGLFQAARDAKKYAIGVDSDQGYIYCTSTSAEERDIGRWILTSMLKRVDTAVYLTAKEYIEKGRIAGGYRTFGLAEGGVDLAVNDYNRAVLAPYLSRIDEIRYRVVRGEVTVPSDDLGLAAWARTLR